MEFQRFQNATHKVSSYNCHRKNENTSSLRTIKLQIVTQLRRFHVAEDDAAAVYGGGHGKRGKRQNLSVRISVQRYQIHKKFTSFRIVMVIINPNIIAAGVLKRK